MKKFFQNKKVLYGIIGILAIIVLFFLFSPRGGAQPQANSLTETVRKGDIALTVAASGRVVAKQSRNVSPETSGKISLVYVGTGDEVNAGQVLAEIENKQITDAVKAAESAFNAASSARNAIRNAPTMPGQEAAKAQQVSAAQGMVNRAKSNLDAAREAAETLKIKAPFAGEVTKVNVNVGDMASPAQPAFSMQTSTDLEATLQINEIDIMNVTEGQVVLAEIDAVRETRKASIYSVVNTGDLVNGVVTYLAKVRFEDIKNLRPGMSLNADIEVASKKDVILVPSAAITKRENKSFVKVVTSKNAQGQPQTEDREIVVGLNNNSYAEVESGLNEGDEVVLTFEE
ncbi:MAG: efflux RND transporter periplasmic adaptor subunit [Candidatus Dojkabacteria bacterium]|nr:MAG: efflux RND transporter periplasmic adaptor subunit [Candidatus Dojkabacteria bacterium]